MAKALGSPAFRVILGDSGDRLSDGGIEARISDTVAVLKRNKTYCVDHGIKIAVENHENFEKSGGEYVKLIPSLNDNDYCVNAFAEYLQQNEYEFDKK